MRNTLAAATLAVGLLIGPAALAQSAPPTGAVQLAYTLTSPGEVALMDLAGLVRTGDVVEGWSLNLFDEPMPTPFAAQPIRVQWSAFTIDCAARTARFTRAIGIGDDGRVVFDAPFDYPLTAVADGWELDASYACDGAVPARPLVPTVEEAMVQARAIMASDAWTAD